MADRRDLDPAPPARRRAPAAAAPPAPDLGGPGTARGPARRDTQSAAPGAAAAGHPGHGPALAPRHRPAPLGCQIQAGQHRPAHHPPELQGPGPPASQGQPRMGIPAGSTASWPAWESRPRRPAVWEILTANGNSPAPRRTGPTWPQFLRSQAQAILACDLFSAGLRGGTQAHVPPPCEITPNADYLHRAGGQIGVVVTRRLSLRCCAGADRPAFACGDLARP